MLLFIFMFLNTEQVVNELDISAIEDLCYYILVSFTNYDTMHKTYHISSVQLG